MMIAFGIWTKFCCRYMTLVAKLVDRYLIFVEDSRANTANGETLDHFKKEMEDAISSKENNHFEL